MTIEDLSAQLAKVERQNRRMKAGGLVALVLLAAATAIGQAASTEKVVRAERFEVVDSTQKLRFSIGTTADGSPVLSLFDAAGKSRAELAVDEASEGTSHFYLLDADGRKRVAIYQIGNHATPGLSLLDGKGIPRLNAFLDDSGAPALMVGDTTTQPSSLLTPTSVAFLEKHGKCRASLGLRTDGTPGLTLADEDGKSRVALLTLPDGAARFELGDKNAKVRASLDVFPDGSPSMWLFDKDGKGSASLLAPTGGSSRLEFFDKDGKVLDRMPK